MVRTSKSGLEGLRTQPMRGGGLASVVGLTWLTGALYCSGYEALSTGLDNWPGSLLWSAAAVLPWLGLFEWSKTNVGRTATATGLKLAGALVATALASLMLEALLDAASDHRMAPVGLSLLRRLPAAAICLLLIFWSRVGVRALRRRDLEVEASLAALARSVDWIEAADNYVELHIAGKTIMRRMTMGEAEQALAGRDFVRIHRRYLVNRNRIASISGGGDLLVRLQGGTELPVGRAFANNLDQAA